MTSALPHSDSNDSTGFTGSVASAEQPPSAIQKVPWVAVAVFVALSLGLAWAVALPLWLNDPESQTFTLLAGILPAAMMFTPLLAVLVVVFVMKVPRGERLRFLGIWPLRPAKRVVWFIVGGMLAPIVLVFACLAVSVLFGWLQLDLVHFSGMQEALPMTLDDAMLKTVVITQLVMIPFGAVINMIPAFGEEIGWRGWLLPALRPMGLWPALLLSGVIWGLWHAPVTLLGHNFGEPNLTGVALMVVGSVLWGIFFGWLRLRSGSIWPAIIGHGALNASAGLVLVVHAAGTPLNLALVNPLGVSGWIVLALVVAVLLVTGQFKHEPQLAAKKAQ